MTNKEKFLKLVSPEKTDTIKKVKHRIKYRKFYRFKNYIILRWLILKDKIQKWI